MSGEILENLTDAQRAAVTHIEGPLLIVAGPGSGKTRVVTSRIAYMLQQGVSPYSIAAFSFTNKAADEMRRRVEKLAPGEPVWMGTFHRFCARTLRQYSSLVGLEPNYSILDADDSKKVLSSVMKESRVEQSVFTPRQIANRISRLKNQVITADEFKPSYGRPIDHVVEAIYPEYQQRLLTANAVDFDDLLLYVANLFKENPELRENLDHRYRYLMVDEYQDTNLAQYMIVRALSINEPNLMAVGDPDQSIYGWRGANLSNILDFENDFPKTRVVKLEKNYRSSPSIIRAADRLIAFNSRRVMKTMYTDNKEGVPVRLVRYAGHRDEAEGIATRIAADLNSGKRSPADFAVLYRTNSLSRTFEEIFTRFGIPFQLVQGFAFFQRKEIKDLLGYLHVLNNPRNDEAVRRIINTPTRGIGKKSLSQLEKFAAHNSLSLWEAARNADKMTGIAKRGKTALLNFGELLDALGGQSTYSVENVVRRVLEETGYAKSLEKSQDPEDADRLANINELINAASEFDERFSGDNALEGFLENSSLASDVDAFDSQAERVSLMTLHACKGLEFSSVFIVAIENGILPHDRSQEDERSIEEERRLLFVGMTRAKEDLQLSNAGRRMLRGVFCPTVPSHFLAELPTEEMDVVLPGKTSGRQRPQRSFRQQPEYDEYAQVPPDSASADGYETYEDYDAIDPPAPEEPVFDFYESKPADSKPKFMTAAEMFGGDDKPRTIAPEIFRVGMKVIHPEYEIGEIVSMSGSGMKKTAIVQFADSERRFRLSHSVLQPVSDE